MSGIPLRRPTLHLDPNCQWYKDKTNVHERNTNSE